MDYNQPYGASAGAPFVNGNPGTGTPGSIPPAGAFEYPQREIVKAITESGQAPSNAVLDQLWKSIHLQPRISVTNAGVTINAQSLGKCYLLDLAIVEVITVPVYTTFPVGFYFEVEAINTPSGFQTSRIQVSGGGTLVFRGVAHNPFYLIGGGEKFGILRGDTGWIVVPVAQGYRRQSYRYTTGQSNATPPAAWQAATLNQHIGDVAIFQSQTGGIKVPVTGFYQITINARIGGNSASWVVLQAAASSTTSPANADLICRDFGSVNNGHDEYINATITDWKQQGSDIFLIEYGDPGGFVVPNYNVLSTAFIGR